MGEPKLVDHLFRHQYGKMVAILTKYFGLSQLEIIEDAIQDTFIKAMMTWRNQKPDNPEAWLNKVAKNRTIDLLRKNQAELIRINQIENGQSAILADDIFLDHEIEDSQLRMIFTACHPKLDLKNQIAFALKTIAGFGTKEIASALLLKEETVKKRLVRAKKTIAEESISFEIPDKKNLPERLNGLLNVIYLTFNEGFHSNNKEKLIREDLCGEAIRLCKLLMKKEMFRSGQLYALFALMCFHASRLETKITENNEIVDLKNQDRTKWHWPMIVIGNDAMNKAMEYEDMSAYHYEAAIAAEHLKAPTFEKTNWQKILQWYEQLDLLQSTASSKLNLAIVHIQLKQFKSAFEILQQIEPKDLEQRSYLYHGCFAEYYFKTENIEKAAYYLDKAIEKVANDLEKKYLMKKKKELLLTN
jgi:RNA polymerase sigma factor (sigma-70 family)